MRPRVPPAPRREIPLELGDQLERHVRLEERELFQPIERSATEPELRRLIADLTR